MMDNIIMVQCVQAYDVLALEIEINLILTLEMVLHLSDLHYQSTGI